MNDKWFQKLFRFFVKKPRQCPNCKGKGKVVRITDLIGSTFWVGESVPCDNCKGKGTISNKK